MPHARIRLESIDESVPAIFAAHEAALEEADAAAAASPAGMEEAVAALTRFLTLAFGQRRS